jgi:molybdopterin/thiamine biosynthesis adenylyltransferase
MSSAQVDTLPSGTFPPVLVSAKKSSSTSQAHERWSYDEAFIRNRGLITEQEQKKLRNSRVAIAGMGGVGGSHLVTLTRLGIGKFTIADPDTFEIANFNRQHGAKCSATGRNKVDTMVCEALDINPELDLRIFKKAIDESNVNDFLDGADVYVDGLDFFVIDIRRLVFRRAAELGIWATTAGPLGFSVASLTFDPAGMGIDEYLNLHDRLDEDEKLISFALGLAPAGTHRSYMQITKQDFHERKGPSVSAACQLASGVAATETVKILLNRGAIRPVPCYAQFDAYTWSLKQGCLRFGNRGPVQWAKHKWAVNQFAAKSHR